MSEREPMSAEERERALERARFLLRGSRRRTYGWEHDLARALLAEHEVRVKAEEALRTIAALEDEADSSQSPSYYAALWEAGEIARAALASEAPDA